MSEQEWTPERIDDFVSEGHLWKEFLAKAINAALDTERQATSNAFSKGYDQGQRDAKALLRTLI